MEDHDYTHEIEALQKQIADMQAKLDDLHSSYHRNNFSASQDFTKYSRFNTRLKVPTPTALPDSCEVGELTSVGGKLYHCSSANTWTSQT